MNKYRAAISSRPGNIWFFEMLLTPTRVSGLRPQAKQIYEVENSANAEKLWLLHEMERTGGEPDVVGQDINTGEYIFPIFAIHRAVLSIMMNRNDRQ